MSSPSLPSSKRRPEEQSEARRPTWVQWLLAIGLALAGSILGAWATAPLDTFLPVLLFLVMVAVATLLGGAVLDSWWAVAALPVAVLVGMAIAFVNVPLETYVPTVVGSWLVLGLPVAAAGAASGFRMRRFVDDRIERSRPLHDPGSAE